MRGLAEKIAVVTGGGGAIGRAICKRLAVEGVTVGAFDRQAAAAAETIHEITTAGGSAFAHAVDITDYDAVMAAVADFQRQAGPIDILVNNAGWDRLAPFLETDPELWRQLIAVNLTGHLNMHHVVLPEMVARGHGRVVNISSDAGRVGSSGESVYAACKGGLAAFTKTLARELATSNITLNVVSPGPTDTPLLWAIRDEGEAGQKIYDGLRRAIPMRRLGTPEDIVGLVAFLASDEADYITGQVVSVSGGLTMHG